MAKDLITTYFTDQTVTSKIMYKIIDNIIITHWLIATFLLFLCTLAPVTGSIKLSEWPVCSGPCCCP